MDPIVFPAIKVSVPGIEPLEFATIQAVETFAKREEAAFSNLFESPIIDGNAQHHRNRLRERFRPIEATLAETRRTLNVVANEANPTPERRAALVQAVKRHSEQVTAAIDQAYRQEPKMWLSTEPQAQFVIQLSKQRPAAAAYAMLHLMRKDFGDDAAEAKDGIFRAQLFEAGITTLRGDSEAAAIREVTKKWRTDAEEMTAELKRLQAEAGAHNNAQSGKIAQVSAQTVEIRMAFENFITAKEAEAKKQRDDAKVELDNLKSAYDAHMKLLAPVEYWRKKKLRHLAERTTLQRWTLGIAAASFGLLTWYVLANVHSYEYTVPWRAILGFFVLSSLVFWVVRVFVRLLLSSIHLSEDAAEREVMAETYMALVRGDTNAVKYVEASDRPVILGALFRSSSMGVIDDGAPPLPAELVSKLSRN